MFMVPGVIEVARESTFSLSYHVAADGEAASGRLRPLLGRVGVPGAVRCAEGGARCVAADFDSPWKEALDIYFRAFLLLLFPEIHDDIDWSRPVEMLDKEFQQLVPRAAQGRRTVDKLVKVWRKNGRAVWVLIHIEVQAQRDRTFTRRMCVYNCRIFDAYESDVVSLAVLADDNPNWRPSAYRRGLWGCSVGMTFPPAKLLDFQEREAELEASTNPFAKVVLAHLKTLETRDDPNDRRVWKFRIARAARMRHRRRGRAAADEVR